MIERNVKPGATVYTEPFRSDSCLSEEYKHYVINPAVVVNGHEHTIENLRLCLMPTLIGTWTCAFPEHMQHYIDEHPLRIALREIEEKRLAYKCLATNMSTKNTIARSKQRAAALQDIAATTHIGLI